MPDNKKPAPEKWGICDKKGWKVYRCYPTKEEAMRHLSNPHLYEVRKVLD